MYLGDEILVQGNDGDELTPAKIINVATLVIEGECMIYKFIVIQLFISIQSPYPESHSIKTYIGEVFKASTFVLTSKEDVQVYQEVVTAVEKGLLPQIRTLSVTSTFIPKNLDQDRTIHSLDKLFQMPLVFKQLNDITESCSSVLTSCLSTETSDSYTNYLQALRDVINTVTEQTGNYFSIRVLKMISHQQGAPDFLEQPFDLQKICGILLESLEFSETSQSELTRYRSIIDISYQTGQSFLDR